MDWKRDGGLSKSGISAVFLTFGAVVWLVVHFVIHFSLPPQREMEAVAGGILALWLIGEWFDKKEDDERKMREAIDLIEEKLDTVLKNQAEMLRKF